MMQHPSDYSRNNQSNVIYINGFSKDDRKCTEKKQIKIYYYSSSIETRNIDYGKQSYGIYIMEKR